VLEPELMLDPAQCRAYAQADFAEPHERCITLLRERLRGLPDAGVALDLGCGPGDVTLRFLAAFPRWRAVAVDGSPAMLALAREEARRRGCAERVRFVEARLPAPLPGEPWALVFSNSLLHHLPDPAVLWRTLAGLGGAAAFVMDLMRPASDAAARDFVDRYAEGEPDVLRHDFYHSLRAAFTPAEVRAQLAAVGLHGLRVEEVSDRHLAVWGAL
jgi:trans-aconitate methyltransferase